MAVSVAGPAAVAGVLLDGAVDAVGVDTAEPATDETDPVVAAAAVRAGAGAEGAGLAFRVGAGAVAPVFGAAPAALGGTAAGGAGLAADFSVAGVAAVLVASDGVGVLAASLGEGGVRSSRAIWSGTLATRELLGKRLVMPCIMRRAASRSAALPNCQNASADSSAPCHSALSL